MQQAVVALGLGALSLAGGPSSAAECVPWSAAGPIIAKHKLVPPHVVYNRIRARISKYGGQIIRASLCPQGGGRFLYKFVVLSPKGNVRTVTIDARTGK